MALQFPLETFEVAFRVLQPTPQVFTSISRFIPRRTMQSAFPPLSRLDVLSVPEVIFRDCSAGRLCIGQHMGHSHWSSARAS